MTLYGDYLTAEHIIISCDVIAHYSCLCMHNCQREHYKAMLCIIVMLLCTLLTYTTSYCCMRKKF